jgi:hypothetical protein
VELQPYYQDVDGVDDDRVHAELHVREIYVSLLEFLSLVLLFLLLSFLLLQLVLRFLLLRGHIRHPLFE